MIFLHSLCQRLDSHGRAQTPSANGARVWNVGLFCSKPFFFFFLLVFTYFPVGVGCWVTFPCFLPVVGLSIRPSKYLPSISALTPVVYITMMITVSIHHFRINRSLAGWAHSQRRVGVNITIPLHWPSCEWTLTLPIFLVFVRYQQYFDFDGSTLQLLRWGQTQRVVSAQLFN